MSPWVLRGLRDGVVTTKWPARPDSYADDWPGPATILRPPTERSQPARPPDPSLVALCPTGAITTQHDGELKLDQGRCVLCGRCVAQRPELFGWSRGPASARLSRTALVVSAITETDEALASVRAGLAARTRVLRRSVHLRHVDAGSDGSEEQEIAALLNPVYDIHRLGIFFTASPRHADVLLVTGAGARGMVGPLRRTYDGMPEPKIVMAVGTDAVSGGLLGRSEDDEHSGLHATAGGVGSIVPVDVWLPGSPPPPFAILHALLAALGRLPASPAPRRDGS